MVASSSSTESYLVNATGKKLQLTESEVKYDLHLMKNGGEKAIDYPSEKNTPEEEEEDNNSPDDKMSVGTQESKPSRTSDRRATTNSGRAGRSTRSASNRTGRSTRGKPATRIIL